MKKSTKKKLKTKYLWFSSRVKIFVKLIIIMVLLAVLIGGVVFYKKYGKDILDSQQKAKEYRNLTERIMAIFHMITPERKAPAAEEA